MVTIVMVMMIAIMVTIVGLHLLTYDCYCICCFALLSYPSLTIPANPSNPSVSPGGGKS